jgi:hypothetical protein
MNRSDGAPTRWVAVWRSLGDAESVLGFCDDRQNFGGFFRNDYCDAQAVRCYDVEVARAETRRQILLRTQARNLRE